MAMGNMWGTVVTMGKMRGTTRSLPTCILITIVRGRRFSAARIASLRLVSGDCCQQNLAAM